MKIITVNLPQSYIEAIESLIGNTGLYPSRSELIRVAVREFLIKELEAAQEFSEYSNHRTRFQPSENTNHPNLRYNVEIDQPNSRFHS